MTPDLSTDEQRYLRAAFAACPREWFRPRTVDPQDFSDRQIDTIVASLARRGLMQAEPERHARLTDQGRKQATLLDRLAARNWPRFYHRRKVRIVVAGGVVAFCVCFVA